MPSGSLSPRRTLFAAAFVSISLSMVSLLACRPLVAKADTIYDVTAAGSNDFVPFEEDPTPGRPLGDHLGNTITFGGTARYLTHVQAVFGSIGPKENDTYTLSLYFNDGALDPNGSGLHFPGTQIASLQTIASNQPLPGNGGYGVDWNFAPLLVPDTLTAVLSSSYSTTTPGQFMGPFVAIIPPLTGSAVNTIWFGDGSAGGWQANSAWAINDGGVTNYFDMRFDAQATVPEPGGIAFGLGVAVCGVWQLARRRRRG